MLREPDLAGLLVYEPDHVVFPVADVVADILVEIVSAEVEGIEVEVEGIDCFCIYNLPSWPFTPLALVNLFPVMKVRNCDTSALGSGGLTSKH